MRLHQIIGTVVAVAFILTGCGTVKEKTAPCKRPTNLTSLVEEKGGGCGPMRRINDPADAFAALGVEITK